MKITRRILAVLVLLLAPLTLLLAAQKPHKMHSKTTKYIAYVGTYTSKTGSKGIYSYRFDTTTGRLTDGAVAAETADPSFVAADASGKFLYAVNEVGEFQGQKSGAVSAFSIDQTTAKLTLLNQVASKGAGTCYVSLDKTGKFVLVASYDSGNVAVFPVQKDGSLGAATALVQHTGTGADKERQEGPHAHWIEVSPDNRFALAVDLGLDEILVYKFDASKGTLTPNDPPFIKLAPRSGPRHITFHPNGKFVFLTSELNSTVTALSYDAKKGVLRALGTLSTLPKEASGHNDTAEIAVSPSGKFLYVSNRGHDSIALFAIDPAQGTLTWTGDFSTRGRTPRHFTIDPSGEFLLAENHESNTIVIFKIDPTTGGLTPTGQTVENPAPVDITFVAAR